MVLPDWTDVSGPDGVAWLRLECKIPLDFSIEPLGSILPTSGSINKLPFSTLALLEGGVRFPLDPLLVECLTRWGAFTTQCSANVYRVVMGVCALNRLLELDLGYNEIMYCYSLVRTKVGLSYLQIRPNRNYLVTNLPDSSTGKDRHYVNISGPLIDPKSEFAASFPMGFGNKASKKINRNFQLSSDRKKLVHQVWQYPDRSAHVLLQYTPRYKSFISQHKAEVPLSPTGTSSESEGIPIEKCSNDPEKTWSETEHEPSSSDSNKTDPAALRKTPTIDDLSLSSSSNSSETPTDNIISIDSESSSDMERRIPSVKDSLKRKTAPSSASPVDKRAKVLDTTEGVKGKGGAVPSKPSKTQNPEVAAPKIIDPAKNGAPKAAETQSNRPPRGGPTDGSNKGMAVWQPKMILVDQGSSRPVLVDDTVEDPLVALAVSEVFLLPKDKGKSMDRSLSQLKERSLCQVGQLANGVAELHRRCTSYEDLLRDAVKKEGMLKNELGKQAERLKASEKNAKEMEGRLEKGGRQLKATREELDKVKNENRVLVKQVEEFPQKLIAEFNIGAEQAMDQATEQIPVLLEEKWADGFRRAWAYALRAANIEPSSDLFSRCDEAIDLTRSQIIGEQASAEQENPNTPASPVILPVTVIETLPVINPTNGVKDTAAVATEKTDLLQTDASSKDLLA